MDLFGICISEGYAAGNACMYQKPTSVGSGIFAGVQEELQRFDTAKRLAKQQLLEALRRLSDNQAASELIQVQEMLLDDTEFSQAVRDQIDSGHCAGQAVTQAAASLADFFRAMDDSYMAARASDFLDIANRLLDCMHENAGPAFSMERPCILVAEELLPSQTLSLDRSKLLGIVTATGSFQSHAAILARSMGIPAITGLDIATIDDGQMLLLDGCHGTLTIDPDPEQYTKFCSEQKNHQSHQAELRRSAFDPAVSADGVRVEVCANIGVLDDITDDTVRCADGVGLFRSEFLYLAHQDYPDEQTQFEAYKYALQRFAPKRVVIRTMDIGADKKVPYFSLPQEDNPALGYRALRICLDRRDIFRTQLRALLRASNYGNLAIMIPMVTKVEEVFQVKTLLSELRQELFQQAEPCGSYEFGIMIETPAAAIMSAELAGLVDFFSIGTNDLTQYTLAADRMNPMLQTIYDQEDEAVLHLLAFAAENAQKHGIWCGICGDLATHTQLLPRLLRCGIRELSVPPASVGLVKAAIRTITVCDHA